MVRTSRLVTLAVASTLLVACGRNGEGDATERVIPSQTGERQTATGCLSMNPESRLYVLTTAPSPMVGTTGGAPRGRIRRQGRSEWGSPGGTGTRSTPKGV